MSRLIAIGDIHGCFEQLLNLIIQLKLTQDDQLVFTGDYIDRGPRNKATLQFLIAIKKKYPKTKFLMGNHDLWFKNIINEKNGTTKYNQNINDWVANGGYETAKEFLSNSSNYDLIVDSEIISFMNELELYYIQDQYLFCHAGVPVGLDTNKIEMNSNLELCMLWIRDDFLHSKYEWNHIIVHGHSPTDGRIEIKHNRICIDGGCVFGGNLIAYDLTNDEIYSVEGIKKEKTK